MVELLAHAEAEACQRRAAGALLARGCTEGDRVAFALGSSADLVCAVLGAARVGLIPVLLNPTLTVAERDVLADNAEPMVRVYNAAELTALTAGQGARPAELAPFPLTRPMHYTSGTTGRPKAVTTEIWDEATARAVYEDEASVWHFDQTDLHMVCSPMYHTVSIRFSTNTLLVGGSLVILSRFDAATALHVLRRHRPSTAFFVPTHLQRILSHPGLGADERFDSLRLLAHAGAPCPESVKRATMARANRDTVWEFYGSTEAQFSICSPAEWLEHPGTVGRARAGRRLFVEPVPDDVRADAPNGLAPTRDGHIGNNEHSAEGGVIWSDMPDFARFGYWRNPEATRRAWRGAACTVGDLGRLDARRLPLSHGPPPRPHHQRGCQRLSRRDRERAGSGGGGRRGGRLRARRRAVGREGLRRLRGRARHRCPTDAEEALRSAASTHLAPYKRPKTYVAAPDLPHTATGKLLRRAVADHLGLSSG